MVVFLTDKDTYATEYSSAAVTASTTGLLTTYQTDSGFSSHERTPLIRRRHMFQPPATYYQIISGSMLLLALVGWLRLAVKTFAAFASLAPLQTRASKHEQSC
jgi:hypothetical protein